MKIGAYTLGLLVAFWWFYHMGETAAKLTCQETKEETNRLSTESKKQSVEVVRNEETIRVSQAQTEAARVSDIHKRREVSRRVQPVNQADNRLPDCRVSDVSIGLLWEASADPRLPEAPNPASTINPPHAD